MFDRLDRDENGVLNADDFDWSVNSPFVRRANLLEQLARALDGNSNGRISQKEWDAFFGKAAGEKGYVTADDLRAALVAPQPSSPPPSPAVMLRGLFNGELGASSEGPEINQPAPDFILPTHDGKRQVRLSDCRGRKPVVLVFGSFT